MNRGPLKFLAALLGTGLVVVPFLGLDGLPRGVRSEIASERSAYAAAQNEFRAGQNEVLRNLQSEQELFATVPVSSRWPAELTSAEAGLQSAGRDIGELAAIEKQNRRKDEQRARTLLVEARRLRSGAMSQANTIRTAAVHWVDLKRHLPEQLQQMEQDYRAIHSMNLEPVAAAIQRAETDWPEKKSDLDTRLAGLRATISQSDTLWQSTAEARRAAAAGDYAHLDFGALLSAAETLHGNAIGLPQQGEGLKSLSAQLYDAWDKILVDMRERGRDYDQKIRTVRTHFQNAAAKGETTSDEKWVPVPQRTFEAMKRDLGMAIEHKAQGKYDSEAERTAQPAGFAYVAPPGQSNQYGYWDHRDGRDFWVFYGQYALLRDLLFNRDYRPLDRGEWEGYRTEQRSGRTYYGNQGEAPKYGSQGTATQNRYAGSTFAQKGGFRDSKYATQSGGYRDSKYSSPSTTPRSFGSGSSGERRASPPAPSPRPSRPSSPSRSPGRTFGSGSRRR